MKKIFTFILILTLLFSLASVSVFAAESAENADMGTSSSVITEDTDARESDKENIFADIYTSLNDNADKVFSALAFIASLILAFVYKNGLLPTVKKAVEGLAEKVSELREETGAANISSAAIEERLKETEEYFKGLSERLEILSEELEESLKSGRKSETMREVMLTEIDMLYSIFMSSSLPEYQKEAVVERVSEMKKTLKEAEKNE